MVCRTCQNVKHGFQEQHDLIHALLESHDNEDGYNLQYTLQATSIFSVKIGSGETFESWKSQAKISLAITPSRGDNKGHIISFLYIK
jgi:hypothetical protein